jgi:hypothetical protein
MFSDNISDRRYARLGDKKESAFSFSFLFYFIFSFVPWMPSLTEAYMRMLLRSVYLTIRRAAFRCQEVHVMVDFVPEAIGTRVAQEQIRHSHIEIY